MDDNAQAWRPLGELCVEHGLLTAAQLADALEAQRTTGGKLGTVLVELGLVQRDQLVAVLLEQCGLSVETQGGFGAGLLVELRRRGVAHVRVAAPVVRPLSEEDAATPRKWRIKRRRPEQPSRVEHTPELRVAFTTLELWAQQLQKDVADLRQLLAAAAAAR